MSGSSVVPTPSQMVSQSRGPICLSWENLERKRMKRPQRQGIPCILLLGHWARMSCVYMEENQPGAILKGPSSDKVPGRNTGTMTEGLCMWAGGALLETWTLWDWGCGCGGEDEGQPGALPTLRGQWVKRLNKGESLNNNYVKSTPTWKESELRTPARFTRHQH